MIPLDENQLDDETKKKLALRRSMVRLVITYAMIFLFLFIILWSLIWMGDRTIATVGANFAGNILLLWFIMRGMSGKINEIFK